MAARETIEQDYALEHITEIYVKLYQQMVGDSRVVLQTESFENQPSADSATGTA